MGLLFSSCLCRPQKSHSLGGIYSSFLPSIPTPAPLILWVSFLRAMGRSPFSSCRSPGSQAGKWSWDLENKVDHQP